MSVIDRQLKTSSYSLRWPVFQPRCCRQPWAFLSDTCTAQMSCSSKVGEFHPGESSPYHATPPLVLALLNCFTQRLVRLAENWVKPLLGEDKPVRRTHRVLPEPRAPGSARGSRRAVNLADDEVVTTARSAPRRRVPRPSSGTPSTIDVDANRSAAAETMSAPENGSDQARDRADTGAPASATGSGMVRQWMSELASGARPVAQGGGTVRAPSESEIAIMTGMFPDMDREAVLGVLQRR